MSVSGARPRQVIAPLATIFAMQAVLTLTAYSVAVVVPIAASDMGLRADDVGYLVSTVYTVAMLTGLASGPMLARLGATRMFQALLALAALGSLVMGLGGAAAAYLGAAILGCATGPMNPSGSHVLARVASARDRALVFSIKQCGTPTGGMLAGGALPALIALLDWRMALTVLPLGLGSVLILAAPLGGLGGPDRGRTQQGWHPRDAIDAVRSALTDGPLRAVTLTGACMAACQMAMTAYLVVYLLQDVGYGAAAAGLVFASLHVAGIAARVLLGFIADRFLSARWVLVSLGGVMGVSLALMATFDARWPLLAVHAVVAMAGGSGNGWVGLFFAELARLAPPGRTADVAAGGQFLMYTGLVCGPLLFGVLLGAGAGYGAALLVFAALSLVAAGYLGLHGGARRTPPQGAGPERAEP